MLTSINFRFTARRVPGGLLLLRDRATGGHGHARLLKFGQRALDLAKLPGFLLSGGRANGHGHYPVHPYSGEMSRKDTFIIHSLSKDSFIRFHLNR